MKTLVAILYCLLPLGMTLAQETRPLQVFGGFSFHTFNCSAIGCSGTNPGALAGWNTEATYFLNHSVGLTADIGGYYGSFSVSPFPGNFQSHVSQYTFLFGPTVRFPPHRERSFLFAHALFGASHGSNTPAPLATYSDAWAMALGGGTDVGITKTIGIQLGYDWLRTKNFNQSQNEFRFSAGPVLYLPGFGKH